MQFMRKARSGSARSLCGNMRHILFDLSLPSLGADTKLRLSSHGIRKFARWSERCDLASIVGLVASVVLLGTGGCQRAENVGSSRGYSSTVVSHMNRGVSLMGQYQYGDAVNAFEQVVQEAPDLMDGRINLAIALFNRNRQEDLAAAELALQEVLKNEPENVRALYFHAILLQHLGKAEAAIPQLESVLQQRAEDGAAWYLMALCRQRVGQPATNEFLKAVQYRPYLFSAYYQLYQTAMRGGQESEAHQYLERFKNLRESPLGESLEFPQYNQMGDLALAVPIPAVSKAEISKSRYQLGSYNLALTPTAAPGAARPARNLGLNRTVAADFDRDGKTDLLVMLDVPGPLALLLGQPGSWVNATFGSGLETVTNAVSCAVGDIDNDEEVDLCLVTTGGPRLFRGLGNHKFLDVTAAMGVTANEYAQSALLLDADHDGDLDLLVCGPKFNQLWNNNGNGTFVNIATQAGVECVDQKSVQVLAGDLDGDRDMDLVILRENAPAKIFLNELLGKYRELELPGLELRGDLGGALQDLNGDGKLDLVLLGGAPARLQLWFGDGHGQFQADQPFAAVSQAAESWGQLQGIRVADMDFDGDLDLICAGSQVHLLLNDGLGRFALQAPLWAPAKGTSLAGFDLVDVTGDLVPDLVTVEQGSGRVGIAVGEISPPSTALAIQPNGVRGRDGRTRSPASGYGVRARLRAGLCESHYSYTGQSGGANQSMLPMILGLGGAASADYVQLQWPDGVAQVEMTLAAGQTHKVAELQRKISSCPVLFAWDGTRFGFVTDFAGVGGLGYFQEPGVSAPPQVEEHVKIQSEQLQPRDGIYELRVTEPMEESAYIDRLELLAVDHPAGTAVFPDERLAISGASPTHRLMTVEHPIFPRRALAPNGRDCTDSLRRADRVYAYEPVLDRRYVGFCQRHTLELDFGDQLAELPDRSPMTLFLRGSIEYPYSQTVYAASQSRVGWEPIRIEALNPKGEWQTVIEDAGAPGGVDRTMTVPLPKLLPNDARKLRLTSNLELYYDQLFLAATPPNDRAQVRTVPLRSATLRYLGFPREYSPDGREPVLYDYEHCDASAPFHRLRGAYTRYGPVEALLREFDDQYAILGPGDEVALRFDAEALPPLPAGQVRSFILVSHAYCKDMDLYTATPRTLEPLPFKGMSRYPYSAAERHSSTEAYRTYLQSYNTRLVE